MAKNTQPLDFPGHQSDNLVSVGDVLRAALSGEDNPMAKLMEGQPVDGTLQAERNLGARRADVASRIADLTGRRQELLAIADTGPLTPQGREELESLTRELLAAQAEDVGLRNAQVTEQG